MLVFRRTEDQEELEAIYRLRYEVYCVEKSFLPAENFPDGTEKDELDEHSVHFVAYEDNCHKELMGYFRLILPNHHGFPVESHFELLEPIANHDTSVELSRLVVEPSARSIGHHILMGLSKQVYLYNREYRVSNCYAVLENPLLRMVQRLGLPFQAVGKRGWFFNTENLPTCMSMEALEAHLSDHNQWFYEYLQAPEYDQDSWF